MRQFIFASLLAALTFPASAQHATTHVVPSPIDSTQLLYDLTVLAADSLQGRAPGTVGHDRARRYLTRRLAEAGVQRWTEDFAVPFRYGEAETPTGINLVGYVPGTAEEPDYIVVTAHYDHLGVRDGVIYNGADDNASGTAALLAMAQEVAAAPLAHTVIFALVDAEERGLQGARAFVAEPPVPFDRIVLNINMDMVSRSPAGELYAAGTHSYPFLGPLLEPVAARSRIALRFGHDRPELGYDDWTNASDHAPFHQAGIPFVYFGVEDHPGYHQPSDDAEAITPGFFVQATATILDALRTLDAGLAASVEQGGGR